MCVSPAGSPSYGPALIRLLCERGADPNAYTLDPQRGINYDHRFEVDDDLPLVSLVALNLTMTMMCANVLFTFVGHCPHKVGRACCARSPRCWSRSHLALALK
jgi:hypothetical protein